MHRRSQSEGKLNVNCIVQSDRQDAVNEVLNRRKRAHRSLDESYKKKVISTDKNADKALLPKRHVRYASMRIEVIVLYSHLQEESVDWDEARLNRCGQRLQ